jgi:hypothetical protein
VSEASTQLPVRISVGSKPAVPADKSTPGLMKFLKAITGQGSGSAGQVWLPRLLIRINSGRIKTVLGDPEAESGSNAPSSGIRST